MHCTALLDAQAFADPGQWLTKVPAVQQWSPHNLLCKWRKSVILPIYSLPLSISTERQLIIVFRVRQGL